MAATPKSATPVPPAPEPANPKPRHRTRNLAIAVVVIVVAIVVGVSIYWYEYRPGGPLNPYHVNVSEVIWTTDGNFYSDSAGFSLIAGKSVPLQIVLYCYPLTPYPGETYTQTCNSGSVYVQTNGFGLISTNAPLSWSSGTSSSGTSTTIYVTVSLPANSYSGTLTIDLH